MLPIPCPNVLRIPKLVDLLSEAGYTPVTGITTVWVEPKTTPPTPEELNSLQRLVGSVINTVG